MTQTEFMPINDDINGCKNPLSKSTENDERTGAMTPGAITNIKDILSKKPHGRIDWTEFCSDSEDESEQNSESKDESEETPLETLKNNYQSISTILDELRIPTDDNFIKRITLLLIVICCRFSIQICEYRSFRTEIQDFFGFSQNKTLNKKMCKNINENKVITKEFIPIFNAILRLVKNAIHIPCTESKISEFQMDLETDSKNIDDNIFRRSVPRAFLIECYHLLMIFLHQKVEKNQTHLLKFVKFGNFDKNIAIENPDFPYDVELNKLLTTFDTLKSNTNLSLFVSIYYQIKDDLENIVNSVNLEHS